MSGGYFNYSQYSLQEVAEQIDELIKTNNNQEIDKYGDRLGRNFTEETIGTFKTTAKMLRLAAILVQRIDYLVECDDSEESYHARLAEELAAHKAKYDN